MLSFKVEYALRILVEMQIMALAGISHVPGEWLKQTCGNDASGMSIVLRILRNLEWLSYDRSTYLYSINNSNVNFDALTLYDLCIHIDSGSGSIAKPLRYDSFSQSIVNFFKGIKLSGFINSPSGEHNPESAVGEPQTGNDSDVSIMPSSSQKRHHINK